MNPHVASISHNLAIIHWTVPRVTYTPETYHVRYGHHNGNKTAPLVEYLSPTIMGTTDLTALNVEYDIVLKDLDNDTSYVVNIVSNNTIVGDGEVSDDITFTTLLMGEYNYTHPQSLYTEAKAIYSAVR